MIQVDNLSFEYPTTRALDEVTFHIPAHSITALVGPNGAGKTTLLRCLAALERPFAGNVQVDGLDTQEEPRAVHRTMGYLSDFFGLYDELTVRQSLGYMGRAHGVPEERVAKAIQRVGLDEYAEVKGGELSRGLRQRLAIGKAILHEPKVLLLDEPASGLDPEARISLGELFLELRDAGMTLLVSSHILAELDQYATDILILRSGRILEHRSVNRADHTEMLQMELLEPDPRLEELLSDQAGVSELSISGGGAEFRFAGDAADRHRLLRELLKGGLAVCSFTTRRANLQETYLSRVSEGGEMGA